MWVLAIDFLAAVVAGWRMLGIDLANLRLRLFGVVLVRLLPRDSRHLTGVPQISPLTAQRSFYWVSGEEGHNCFLSIIIHDMTSP
ncbi:hypothetical protein B9Z55_028745 [Caenorhabditis nigoni]|uniref:Uncharacterized protein n=1 Tax=Caenorhabditis nigoni TaxID=1611254 RepID=A0A2G5SA37_9PELO|nr:hypothetical protein B9Z55_028745 [Caenorhabditis nigoni]